MTTDWQDIELAEAMRRHPAGKARETDLRATLMQIVDMWERLQADNDALYYQHLNKADESREMGDWEGRSYWEGKAGEAARVRDVHDLHARAIREALA